MQHEGKSNRGVVKRGQLQDAGTVRICKNNHNNREIFSIDRRFAQTVFCFEQHSFRSSLLKSPEQEELLLWNPKPCPHPQRGPGDRVDMGFFSAAPAHAHDHSLPWSPHFSARQTFLRSSSCSFLSLSPFLSSSSLQRPFPFFTHSLLLFFPSPSTAWLCTIPHCASCVSVSPSPFHCQPLLALLLPRTLFIGLYRPTPITSSSFSLSHPLFSRFRYGITKPLIIAIKL